MSSESPAVCNAWIDHTGDGTLVHDTDRADTELRQHLKRAGFKYSHRLGAWYLPKTWHFATRGARVDLLLSELDSVGRALPVKRNRERTRTSAEIEAERVARAADRAERLDSKADDLEAAADRLTTTARQNLEAWPLGQPLVGSPPAMRRQRRWLDKQRRRMDKAHELDQQAQEARHRAATAEVTAQANESPHLISRRLERLRADLRRIERRTAGSDSPDSRPATNEHRQQLLAEAADLAERIMWNESILAEAEEKRGRLWTADDFVPGDEVRVGGRWYPVKRVNRKSVTIPPIVDLGEDRGRSWADRVPYSNIRGRRRDGVTQHTPDDTAGAICGDQEGSSHVHRE